MVNDTAGVFRFGPFKADLTNRQLWRNGVPLALSGQPFDILAMLLEHPRQLVSREQMRARLWPSGTVVEFDHSIDAAVTRLREVLGDKAQQPRFIVTVPRHGYRFVAPVSRSVMTRHKEAAALAPSADRSTKSGQIVSSETVTASRYLSVVAASERASRIPGRRLGWAALAALVAGVALVGVARVWISWHSGPSERSSSNTRQPASSAHNSPEAVSSRPLPNSIAVLPFADMSERKDQEYFADGLADELLDRLAREAGLHVVARTSSFSFKGSADDIPTIASKLNVANILEGSIRRSGNHIRVTTQLVRAADGGHLWSETYDRELKDIFEVQDGIAAAVAAALNVTLARGGRSMPSRSANVDAYLQYLLGQQYFGRGSDKNFRRAIEAYRHAIALDPNFAAAYAGLGTAEAYLADDVGDIAGLNRAKINVERAIALAPNEALGYAARGFVRFNYDWNWSGAEADLARALALDPHDAFVLRRYSALMVYEGRLPEGIALSRRVTDIDPFSTQAWNNLAWSLISSGDLASARQALGRALTIDPTYVYALSNLGIVELLEHKPLAALAMFRRIPGDEATGLLGMRLAGVAVAEHMLGHEPESQQAVDEAIIKVPHSAAFQIAQAYAGRGEADQAFQWLDRAYRQRDGGLTGLKRDPLLRLLQPDPRYKALLRKLNLPE